MMCVQATVNVSCLSLGRQNIFEGMCVERQWQAFLVYKRFVNLIYSNLLISSCIVYAFDFML